MTGFVQIGHRQSKHLVWWYHEKVWDCFCLDDCSLCLVSRHWKSAVEFETNARLRRRKYIQENRQRMAETPQVGIPHKVFGGCCVFGAPWMDDFKMSCNSVSTYLCGSYQLKLVSHQVYRKCLIIRFRIIHVLHLVLHKLFIIVVLYQSDCFGWRYYALVIEAHYSWKLLLLSCI